MSRDPSSTPAGSATVEQVRLEAERLHALLCENLIGYSRKARPVSLSEDTPERIRVLWDVLGYSDALGSLLLAPDDGDTTLEFQEIVEGWAEADETWAELATRLPQKLRVVSRYDSQDFWITDESGDAPDPPVWCASEGGQLVPICRSYLFFVTQALLLGPALRGLNGVDLRLSPEPPAAHPFLALAPNVARFEGELWALPGNTEQPDPDDFNTAMAFPSIARVVEFVTSLPDGVVEYAGAPHATPPIVLATEPDAFSSLKPIWAGQRHSVLTGRLADVPVWTVVSRQRAPEIFCDVGDRDRLRQWLERQGALPGRPG